MINSTSLCDVSVGIHQPNFFPWLGYFDKIIKSDKFIFLDDVQIPKKGGSWINRVKILAGAHEQWLTAPLDRSYSGVRQIKEVNYIATDWRREILNKLDIGYRNHDFYDVVIRDIKNIVDFECNNVAIYNMNCVRNLCIHLSIDTSKFCLASDFNVVTKSNERLCELVKNVKGSTYLYGGGAASYQDDDVFHAFGLSTKAQDFNHPIYYQSQTEYFTPNLSIIDVVMNVGWNGVMKLLQHE